MTKTNNIPTFIPIVKTRAQKTKEENQCQTNPIAPEVNYKNSTTHTSFPTQDINIKRLIEQFIQQQLQLSMSVEELGKEMKTLKMNSEHCFRREISTQTESLKPPVNELDKSEMSMDLQEMKETIKTLQTKIKCVEIKNKCMNHSRNVPNHRYNEIDEHTTRPFNSLTNYSIKTSNRFALLSCQDTEEHQPVTHSQASNKHYTTSTKSQTKKHNFHQTTTLPKKHFQKDNTTIKLPFKHLTIYADSHGRSLAQKIRENTKEVNVTGMCKPNAKLRSVLPCVNNQKQSKNECIVVIGGTNDVSNEEGHRIHDTLIETIANYKHNILIVTLPHRHDLPTHHPNNEEILFVNSKICQLNDQENNISILNIDTFKRSLFTKHGLHLNSQGKRHLSSLIISSIKKMQVNGDKPTLGLKSIFKSRYQINTYAEVLKSPCSLSRQENNVSSLENGQQHFNYSDYDLNGPSTSKDSPTSLHLDHASQTQPQRTKNTLGDNFLCLTKTRWMNVR